MPALIVATGNQRGVFLNLGRKTSVVGRDEAVPLQLEDERVSRKHAQFRFDPADGSYRLLDMSSRNGTLLNNKPLALEATLKDGDEVTIGDTVLLFTNDVPENQPNALELLKKVGERRRDTLS